MYTRQTQTRTEFAVRYRRTGGYGIGTEYRRTREAAEALRERLDVISIEQVERLLDY